MSFLVSDVYYLIGLPIRGVDVTVLPYLLSEIIDLLRSPLRSTNLLLQVIERSLFIIVNLLLKYIKETTLRMYFLGFQIFPPLFYSQIQFLIVSLLLIYPLLWQLLTKRQNFKSYNYYYTSEILPNHNFYFLFSHEPITTI